MENIFEIKGLCKKYGTFSLNNINLSLPKGIIMGFIGANGAGKTTTIKAILNIITRDSGEINIFGLDNRSFEKEIKNRIGVVLDDCFFNEDYKVKDINSIMKNLYTNWNSKEYYNYLHRFSLPENKKIKTFSSGMKMKLKLSVALSHGAELLILDEPTSGLDPIVRSEILSILRDFIQNPEHSVFLSSHITSDLEHIADYVAFIDNGSIIFNLSMDEIYESYCIARCSEEEFERIDKGEIIRFTKERYSYNVLIKNREAFKRKYGIEIVDRPNLEEIMVLYVRGGYFVHENNQRHSY